MAIQIGGSFVFSLIGDGVSTSISIDLKDLIALKGILPNIPTSVIRASTTTTPTITSTSLNRFTVTVNFSGVVDSGVLDLFIGF